MSTPVPLYRRNSSAITEGPHRAGARAMLKAVGFDDEALKKPIVGVANTWIEIGPCNYHLRGLAEHVKQGIREAGGTPMEFNTVSISDGITMGSVGMRTSPHQPRGHRRLDRARRPRQLLRRRRRALRLRQDDPGHDDGRGAARRAGPGAVRRIDRAWPLSRSRRHDSGRLRGHRRACGRQDDRRRAEGSRGSRLSGCGRLRRPVHRQHHGDRDRVPWHRADGQRLGPGRSIRPRPKSAAAPAGSSWTWSARTSRHDRS